MKTLTIKLTAPLQSYGNEANFERRTSWPVPSKSAVIGMIGAALGMRRDNPEITKLNDLAFAVRTDQRGKVLTDFHTVEWKTDTRKLTYRDYYQDAVYVVAIGGDDEEIDRIADALKHPKFQLYLGRRSCPPAGILKTNVFEDANPVEALKQLPWQASSWYQKKLRKENYKTEIVADANLIDNPNVTWTEKDRVESFNPRYRHFGFRVLAKTRVELENPSYHASMEHDAFGAV
ncbi:CRISPR system CASCADE complex protein CasD [Lactobacillus equicursoris DSM 19284 = JCM 14600 = CIP 110162]|uniref:CRISPR-associated protein n=1 Tax=Lactobacillus equicursoris DSM 19284 = JCM 14600 = CIP 110162 TaxID=1293597 RepID=K0NL62_9LACO|nr:type I-E CRISPR-associated protein Cas5/CasD [Lactobacillus equicursoris]KRL00240.1 CRISPR-associated protein [Lactobacillus equicursoris DSM 19284 = JCM 14600 = CIP 110162]MDD6386074.1 type I-E CRISPR-associated protein Cas5/CasD [Lactobacillus equicursoris]CCK86082.1 CRISPR system CASCADE complex protein CasD [Lactobacillus equicursoris DSM 19284 = JCM 14600 = CIP 110162]